MSKFTIKYIRRRLEAELESARRQKEKLSAELERIEAESGDCFTDELRKACEKFGKACSRVIKAAEALEKFDTCNEIENENKPVFFADVIAELKSYGFKWVRSVGAWQRQLTENAINAARRITT